MHIKYPQISGGILQNLQCFCIGLKKLPMPDFVFFIKKNSLDTKAKCFVGYSVIHWIFCDLSDRYGYFDV